MSFLLLVQIVLALLLSFGILLQHRVSGLSATFGGSGAIQVQRRGAERVIYQLTIWLSIAFFGLAVLEWFL